MNMTGRLAPRLLPSTIALMIGLLGLKVFDLVLHVSDRSRHAEASLLPLGGPAQAARVASEAFRPAADEASQRQAQAQNQAQGQPQPPVQGAAVGQQEPAPPSAAERALLEELRARRVALDAREQALVVRESVLVATEQRLARRVEELTALQQRLEVLDKAAREREDAGWRGLVRIYENMRPRDAARIFNELEMVTLVEVVDRMKERTAAPILAGMEPDKAKALTAELARRRAGGARAEAGG